MIKNLNQEKPNYNEQVLLFQDNEIDKHHTAIYTNKTVDNKPCWLSSAGYQFKCLDSDKWVRISDIKRFLN